MNKIKTLIVSLIYIFITTTVNADYNGQPPKIMLFTCNYGAGHKMATQGIMESLPECIFQVVDIYDEPLRHLDPLRSLSPKLSNEYLYNLMMKNEHNYLLNFIWKIGPTTVLWQKKKIENILRDYISEQKPDMLISCVPLVNSILLDITKEFDIPLLVVTTDIDISAFCYGFENDSLVNDSSLFRITVPYSEEHWKELLGKKHSESLQQSFQYNFGYPTRKSFSEPVPESVLENLRLEYDVREDENLILVMMGGNTSQAAQTYAKLLLSMDDNELDQILGSQNTRDKIHLICLCGDINENENDTLMINLNQLNGKSRKNFRVRVQGYPGTNKIAELISLPELKTVISKPGGSTVNEMIKKKMPMIYHISSVSLDWEWGNVIYGEARNYGMSYQTSGKINHEARQKLIQVLTHTFALHQHLHTDNNSVPEAEIDFSSNLRKAVEEMIINKVIY